MGTGGRDYRDYSEPPPKARTLRKSWLGAAKAESSIFHFFLLFWFTICSFFSFNRFYHTCGHDSPGIEPYFVWVGNRITITNTLKRVKNTVFLIFSKTVTASSPCFFQASSSFLLSLSLPITRTHARTQRDLPVVIPSKGIREGVVVNVSGYFPATSSSSIDYCLQEHTIAAGTKKNGNERTREKTEMRKNVSFDRNGVSWENVVDC